MVVVGVPPLEFWVLSVLQDVLLALEVGVVVADPGSALHTDRVHPENTQQKYSDGVRGFYSPHKPYVLISHVAQVTQT